jgi:hypothetical protein
MKCEEGLPSVNTMSKHECICVGDYVGYSVLAQLSSSRSMILTPCETANRFRRTYTKPQETGVVPSERKLPYNACVSWPMVSLHHLRDGVVVRALSDSKLF